jgi:hypothetical protein
MFGYERAIAANRSPASVKAFFASNDAIKKVVTIVLDPAENPKLKLSRLSFDEIQTNSVLSAKYRAYERRLTLLQSDVPED